MSITLFQRKLYRCLLCRRGDMFKPLSGQQCLFGASAASMMLCFRAECFQWWYQLHEKGVAVWTGTHVLQMAEGCVLPSSRGHHPNASASTSSRIRACPSINPFNLHRAKSSLNDLSSTRASLRIRFVCPVVILCHGRDTLMSCDNTMSMTSEVSESSV